MAGKGGEIIRKALARALFDASPRLEDGLRWTPLDGRPPPCDGPGELARLIVEDMEHAGWVMKSSRDCPASAGMHRRRLDLQDQVKFGIERAGREALRQLLSADRAEADAGRELTTQKITETFNLMRVVLGKPRRAAQGSDSQK